MNTTDLLLELTDLMRQYLNEEYAKNSSIYSDAIKLSFFNTSSNKPGFQRSVGLPPQPPLKISQPVNITSPIKTTTVIPQEIGIKKEMKEKPKLEIKSLEKSEKKMGMMKKRLNQEPLSPSQEGNFSEMKSIVKEKCSSFKLKETLPNDEEAKFQENLWKQVHVHPECVIFSYQDPPQVRKFLQNIEIALKSFLRVKVVDAKRLESEGGWDKLFSSKDLKYVISCQSIINRLPVLKGFSTELEDKTFLGEVPLLVLEDPIAYFKDPIKKKLLWESFYREKLLF